MADIGGGGGRKSPFEPNSSGQHGSGQHGAGRPGPPSRGGPRGQFSPSSPDLRGSTPEPAPHDGKPGPPPTEAKKPWNAWPISGLAAVVNLVLFWQIPVAAVALAFSYLVDSRWKRGDTAGARKASGSVFVFSAVSIVFSALMFLYPSIADSIGTAVNFE